MKTPILAAALLLVAITSAAAPVGTVVIPLNKSTFDNYTGRVSARFNGLQSDSTADTQAGIIQKLAQPADGPILTVNQHADESDDSGKIVVKDKTGTVRLIIEADGKMRFR